MFDDFPKSECQIVAPDGSIRGSTRAIFTGGVIVIDDPKIVVLAGDEIRRRLPNGTEEAFDVIDPKFYDRMDGINAHFQVQVRRKGAFPKGTGGNFTINLSGQNSRINISSHDSSVNYAVTGNVFGDLSAQIRSRVANEADRLNLLAAVEEMKEQQHSAGFAAAYQKFISISADHIGIVAPFLPALASFFG
jgi:RNA 3'-terminal phosphate cyclase